MDENVLSLLTKYDVPTPRYTSYPTVPYWNFSSLDSSKWKHSVVNTFRSENAEVCIYIHLPFCESLCTFCARNKRITKNHTKRFEELLEVVNAVAFKKMDERLLNFIKKKCENTKSDTLNLTHEQISNELGTARVVVSRLLKQMEDEGLVKLGRNKISLV